MIISYSNKVYLQIITVTPPRRRRPSLSAHQKEHS